MFQSLSPPEFLSRPGQRPGSWRHWYDDFLVFAEANGWSDWTDDRRTAFLMTAVGAEARRLYRAAASAGKPADIKPEVSDGSEQSVVADVTKFDKAVAIFKKLFETDFDVRSARMKFRKCTQGHDESNVIYLANLREAVASCNFGALTDEMLRDKFIEGCRSDQLRDKLIMIDDLSLSKLEEVAEAHDRGLQRRALLHGSSGATAAAAVEVAYAGRRSNTSRSDTPRKQMQRQQHVKKSGTCRACGTAGHWANDKECRARNQKCFKCNATGHFSKFCSRSRKSGVVDAVQILSVSAGDDVCQVSQNVTCPYYDAFIDRKRVRMLVDTGSAVSIIPARTYRQLYSHVPLRPAGKLAQWNGSGIKVLGKMSADVTGPRQMTVPAEFYVAVGNVPIMGRDLQQQLGVTVSGGSVVCQVQQEQALPAIKGFVHKVRMVSGAVPSPARLRSLPYAVRQEVSDHLESLEAQGIIEKVPCGSSPWLSPIVAVRKRGGQGLRVCLDLTSVNKSIVANGYPIPDMQEMLDKLRGAKMMSKLDMKSAYHQLELHEESRNLTAFVHEGQTWRYKRCCFGLKSLPQCFQKLMETVLQGIPGVQVYLDDVLVAAATRKEHDERINSVMKRLKDFNITLNRDKCLLGVESLEFLGFIVSQRGIEISPDRVQGLRDMGQPKSQKELQAALGSLAFYSRFVPSFSSRVEPLRKQLRKDAPPFKWTEEMSAAMEDVKSAILNSSALAPFDPSLQTYVTTDASDVGLGAVLSQLHPEGERVVAFASCTLSAAQRKYSVTDREGLACVWACQKWHKYLWGKEFVLRTDHAALRSLLSAKGIGRASMRMSRWAVKLMTYTFQVQHIQGKANQADGISRLPGSHQVAEEEDQLVAALEELMPAVSSADIAAAGSEDDEVRALTSQIPQRWPFSLKNVPSALKPYFKYRHELSIEKGMVFRGERIVVPSSLRTRVIAVAHESHPGIVRTKQRLRAIFWWPGMDSEVEEAIRSCPTCSVADKSAKTCRTPLIPVPLPAAAWDKVAVDFIGPMQGPASQRYGIVLTDYYSKWPEVAFVGEPSSDAVIDFLTSVASREGWPKELVSDNGTHFTSSKFALFLQANGVKHIKVSPYHPAGSGAVERFNRSLKSAIQTGDQQGADRRRHVQRFLMVYRATPHATTGRSPSELLHGRRLRTSLENAVVRSSDSNDDGAVQQRVRDKQRKMKRYHDRTASKPNIKVGDLVRYRLMPRPRKGRPQFSKPCVVIAQRGPVSFELEGGIRVHAERLSPCHTSVRRSSHSGGGGEVVEPDLLPDLHDHHRQQRRSADERSGARGSVSEPRAPLDVRGDVCGDAMTDDVGSGDGAGEDASGGVVDGDCDDGGGGVEGPSRSVEDDDGDASGDVENDDCVGSGDGFESGDVEADVSENASSYRTRAGRATKRWWK